MSPCRVRIIEVMFISVRGHLHDVLSLVIVCVLVVPQVAVSHAFNTNHTFEGLLMVGRVGTNQMTDRQRKEKEIEYCLFCLDRLAWIASNMMNDAVVFTFFFLFFLHCIHSFFISFLHTLRLVSRATLPLVVSCSCWFSHTEQTTASEPAHVLIACHSYIDMLRHIRPSQSYPYCSTIQFK